MALPIWLTAQPSPTIPQLLADRVRELLTKVAAKQIDGVLVRIVDFDEALRDIVRLCKDLDTTAIDAFAAERRRWSPSPFQLARAVGLSSDRMLCRLRPCPRTADASSARSAGLGISVKLRCCHE